MADKNSKNYTKQDLKERIAKLEKYTEEIDRGSGMQAQRVHADLQRLGTVLVKLLDDKTPETHMEIDHGRKEFQKRFVFLVGDYYLDNEADKIVKVNHVWDNVEVVEQTETTTTVKFDDKEVKLPVGKTAGFEATDDELRKAMGKPLKAATPKIEVVKS